MYEGIGEELGATVGVDVNWYRWQDYYLNDNYSKIVDDIYDVSSSKISEGRRWMLPFKMPVVMAQFIRGTNVMNERGFYVSDTLRVVMNVGDVQRFLPSLLTNSNVHIKDRVEYRGEVFVPTRVLPRGSFGYNWAVVTVDFNQLNPEELVNDPQFQKYAIPSAQDNRAKVAELISLEVDGFSIAQFSHSTFTYDLIYANTATKVSLTPTAMDAKNSTIEIDGNIVQSGATTDLTIGSGVTEFTVDVIVTAGDGQSNNIYTLNFTEV
jgi:hypothetical protein